MTNLTASSLLGTVNKTAIADLGVTTILATNSWLFFTGCAAGASNVDSANGIVPDFSGCTQIAPVVGTSRVMSKIAAQSSVNSISDDGSGLKYNASGMTAEAGKICANQWGFIGSQDPASSTCQVSTNFGKTWPTGTGAVFAAAVMDAVCDNVSANANAVFIGDGFASTTVVQNGATVSAVALPNAGTAKRAKLINGFFVLATNRGIAYMTPGQKTYTEVLPTGGTSAFESIDYSPELGLYIAVGDAGKIYTAPAAAGVAPPAAGSWTSRAGITTGINYEAVWCPTQKKPDGTVTFAGKFVVAGVGTASLSAMQYSTDGVTWTAATGPSFVSAATTFERRSIAFRPSHNSSGGILIGITNAATGLCHRSTDGITWVAATTGTTGAGPTGAAQNVIATPRGFVAMTSVTGTATPFFTPDGDVWASFSTLGWATLSTGGDTVIYGSVSGEICRLKGGLGFVATGVPGANGGSSTATGGLGAPAVSVGGSGADGNGGPAASAPANQPSTQSLGGTGGASISQGSGGGTALQAWRFPNGFPEKIPGAGGGAGGSSVGGGGGSSAFGRGGDGLNGGQPASGPGAGGAGVKTAQATGGAGGGESAMRFILTVVPGETITMVPGQALAGKTFVAATVGNDGFASLEMAA